MSIPYLVRKKVFFQGGIWKTLWYAVQSKLQEKGGKNEKDLARIIGERTSFHHGEVLGVLSELPQVIEELLERGNSVTISGLGTFHAAVSSEGAEKPEDVTPGKVFVSRVYFTCDRRMSERIKETQFVRIPLSYYLPKELVSEKVWQAEQQDQPSWEEQEE
ncbi:MAG: HU family DNA-binding protein [Bacteroides sp.]|nr:HU family DNA-binding protein [Bacteroides sp.]